MMVTTGDSIKDNEVFRRLLILNITPHVTEKHNNYYNAASFALDYANTVISEMEKGKHKNEN